MTTRLSRARHGSSEKVPTVVSRETPRVDTSIRVPSPRAISAMILSFTRFSRTDRHPPRSRLCPIELRLLAPSRPSAPAASGFGQSHQWMFHVKRCSEPGIEGHLRASTPTPAKSKRSACTRPRAYRCAQGWHTTNTDAPDGLPELHGSAVPTMERAGYAYMRPAAEKAHSARPAQFHVKHPSARPGIPHMGTTETTRRRGGRHAAEASQCMAA